MKLKESIGFLEFPFDFDGMASQVSVYTNRKGEIDVYSSTRIPNKWEAESDSASIGISLKQTSKSSVYAWVIKNPSENTYAENCEELADWIVGLFDSGYALELDED